VTPQEEYNAFSQSKIVGFQQGGNPNFPNNSFKKDHQCEVQPIKAIS
jgi:hypothetical protein